MALQRSLRGVTLALLLLAVALGSCSEDADAGGTGGGTALAGSTLPPGCEDDFRDFVTTLHDAKACTDATECTFVFGKTPLWEFCGSGYYLNASAALLQPVDGGPSALAAREAALEHCFVPFSAGCFAPAPPARCWRGKCWPTNSAGGSAITDADACFAVSDQSPCSECLCAARADEMRRCLDDPGCAAILKCARKRGLLVRYDFDTGGLPYPPGTCASLYAQASGATQSSFSSIAYASSHAGCFAFCGP